MKKTLLTYFYIILLCLSGKMFSQTYQLTGNPVNTTGWNIVPVATVSGDFIQLTGNLISQAGGIKLNAPINLKSCDKWKVEFDFRIDGSGTYAHGDGIAFWYLANPPVTYLNGGGLGIPTNADGFMVGFDIYNNTNDSEMSKVHVLYGTNNVSNGNIEFNNTPGSTFHSPNLTSTLPFIGSNYKHVEVNGTVDPANPANWIINIKIDNTVIVNQTFAPSGAATTMTQGYFGFSASTGAACARQSIKNVKVYLEKVPTLQSTFTPFVCVNPTTGNGTIDLTSFQNQIVTTPANYIFTYYVLGNSVPIANPANFQYSGNTTVVVFIKDPSSTLCDADVQIILNPTPFAAVDATLTGCNNNNAGVAIFDLTTAAVTTVAGVTKKFYPTLADLNAGTNEILNPTTYSSAPGFIYVKVTTPQGCVSNAKITLNHFAVVTVNDATLRACFIETNPSTGLFNLTNASVTTQGGITKKYYPSLADAQNGTNEIPATAAAAYIAPNGVVYIKVTNGNGCYAIAKVTLIVIAPVYSTVLKDKTICMEDKTTLDAGPGFSSYQWSTGATTQSISNVGVGTYWVKLKTGDCIATQKVTIFPSEQPVITNVDISTTTITINVMGGTPAYQYSMDNINWQDSNIFKNVPRGDNKVYVRDAYDCEPIDITIVVPNIINVITPNGDGINDAIDYSALANKKNLVFNVFDRYGAKIHQGDKSTRYRWDGTIAGRKVPTGSYWYSVTWNENDKKNTPFKYSDWVLVKNRE